MVTDSTSATAAGVPPEDRATAAEVLAEVEAGQWRDGQTDTAAVCPCGATLPVEGVSGLLRAIADHIERGDEFRDGQWVACAPVTGDGEKWPWQRKPFVYGVTIAREVQVEQLRRLADWHWSPDE